MGSRPSHDAGDYWSADSGSRTKANALFSFVITSLARVDPRTRARFGVPMCRLNPKGLQISGLRVTRDPVHSTRQMSATGKITGQVGRNLALGRPMPAISKHNAVLACDPQAVAAPFIQLSTWYAEASWAPSLGLFGESSVSPGGPARNVRIAEARPLH